MIFKNCAYEFHIGGSIHHQEQLHWHREARDRKSYGIPSPSSAITIHTFLITTVRAFGTESEQTYTRMNIS